MKSFLKFVIMTNMGDSMDFLITLDQFEGPLDLMLHLIKENKLDLFDLDMNVLATQYIDYIHAMQNMHLEVASEYLSELASLIAYKSKKLLPREIVEVEEEYEEDQRDQLVARLLEYQRYKEVSLALKEDYEQRQLHFSRPVSSLVEEWKVPVESDTLEAQSPYDLMKAMCHCIVRMELLQPYETKITIKELSIEERAVQIKERMKHLEGSISFQNLCADCTSLHMVIVTFLSILDLIHEKWMTYSIDETQMIWVAREDL